MKTAVCLSFLGWGFAQVCGRSGGFEVLVLFLQMGVHRQAIGSIQVPHGT